MRRRNGRSWSKTRLARLILHYQAGYANYPVPIQILTLLLLLLLLLFFQGTWGGVGLTKPPPKPERIKHFPGIDPSKRQDAGKSHVIISEKKDKKAEKYLVKDLPFPYTSKAQFERRMEVPLGVEWNTRKGFQRGTMPRVTKKVRLFFGFAFFFCRRGCWSGVLVPSSDLLMSLVGVRSEQSSTLWRSFFDGHVSLYSRLISNLGPLQVKPPCLVTRDCRRRP